MENNNPSSEREKTQAEKEKRKRLKKDRKKREKKQQKKQLQEIKLFCEMITRVIDSQKNNEDMNLRCYMFLYNIKLLLEGVHTGSLLMDDLPKGSKDIIPEYLRPIKEEVTTLMTWVINDRNILPSVVHPLPEVNPQ